MPSWRIATWNLNRAGLKGIREDPLRACIRNVNADVWVLTETHRDFSPSPGHKLVACSARAPELTKSTGEVWVAIWVRSKCKARKVVVNAEQERLAAASVRGLGVGPVLVIGTVLPWNNDTRYHPHRGAAAYRKARELQAAEWFRLQTLNPNRGICLAGDFNQDLVPWHYYGSDEGKLGLLLTFSELGLECLTSGIRDPLAKAPDLASVDHLCLGGGLRHFRAKPSTAWPMPGTLEKTTLTDHYGVFADVRA